MKPKISLAEAQRLADSGLNGPAIARALGVHRGRIAYLIKIGTLRCAVGTWGGRRWGKPEQKDAWKPIGDLARRLVEKAAARE